MRSASAASAGKRMHRASTERNKHTFFGALRVTSGSFEHVSSALPSAIPYLPTAPLAWHTHVSQSVVHRQTRLFLTQTFQASISSLPYPVYLTAHLKAQTAPNPRRPPSITHAQHTLRAGRTPIRTPVSQHTMPRALSMVFSCWR